MGKSLEKALDENRGVGPGFNLIRHVLAFVILLLHCYLATRIHPVLATASANAQVLNTPQLGHASKFMNLLRPILFSFVGAFFALSGFLVMGSAVRTRSVVNFFVNRALRIVPALSVEVMLSALILGPVVTSFGYIEYFSDPLFARYLWNIVGHVQFVLPGVFVNNPWSTTVNLNLWTLPAELFSYLFMIAVMVSGVLRDAKLARYVITGASLAMMLGSFVDPAWLMVKANNTHFSKWYIVVMFVLGAAFFVNRDIIPIKASVFIASLAAYYAMVFFDILLPLCGIPLTYCVVYIGMCHFKRFDQVVRMDLSYGTYLYGFPITQAAVFFLLRQYPSWHSSMKLFLVVTPITIFATSIFAVVSWLNIEKPALSLRRFIVPAKRSGKLPANAPVAAAFGKSN